MSSEAIQIPVLIADNDGTPVLEIAQGALQGDTLTVQFKTDHIPGMAIKRILSRGVNSLGLVFAQMEDPEETPTNLPEGA